MGSRRRTSITTIPAKTRFCSDVLDTYLSALRDRLDGLSLEGKPAPEKLSMLIHETLLAYEGMDCEHKIQLEGLALLPVPEQEILKGYQRDMVRQMGDVLREIAPDVLGQDRKKLRSAVMSVFGMLNWFYMWNPRASLEAREDYAMVVSQMALKGLNGL